MEHKDYIFEIVSVLMRGSNHIRGISNSIKTNHMMVVRKINSLEKMNVVDYRIEGRNKTYFLKDSPEARGYVLMAEDYRLMGLLSKYPFLREVISKIQKDRKIGLAFVFGSYAKGTETKRSDIDIYFESQDASLKKEYSKDSKFSVKLGKWDKNNFLIKEIIDNHILLKGGEKYYEKVFG